MYTGHAGFSLAFAIERFETYGIVAKPKTLGYGKLILLADNGWSWGAKRVEEARTACVKEANAGIGIPLGDRCTVESGLYITAGTKVSILDDQNHLVESVKARDLAGKSDLLFRRNSANGAVECLTNKSAVELNEELHTNN